MYACRWLDVRKTLGGLTFEAKKLHWLMSHFSCLWLYFISYEWPLFSQSCFMAIKITPTMQILYSSFWPKGKLLQEKSWIFFFFYPDLKGKARLGTTLESAPYRKVGSFLTEPWVRKTRQFTCGHIRYWHCTGLPSAGEMDPWCQLRGIFSLKHSGSVSLKLYTTQLLL